MQKEIKVFIVSPSDVKEEREAVIRVCKKFNNSKNKDLRVKAIGWERIPMSFLKNPQHNINSYFYNSDIYIVILWRRLGSKVKGLVGELTWQKDVTGTQYEIEYLIANQKENILFYIKEKDLNIPIDNAKEALEQKVALDNFLTKIGFVKNNTKYSYYTFKDIKEFEEMVQEHLKNLIESMIQKEVYISLEEINNVRKDIHPSYWVGLYMVIVSLGVILFLYNIDATYAKSIKVFLDFYAWSLMFLMIPSVKSLPTNTKNVGDFSFKEILVKLIRRFLFIIFTAFLLATVLNLTISLMLKSIVNLKNNI